MAKRTPKNPDAPHDRPPPPPPKRKTDPEPAPPPPPPADVPEVTVREAEDFAKEKQAAEAAAKVAMLKSKRCLSCDGTMKDGKCEQCGAIIKGGELVAKAPTGGMKDAGSNADADAGLFAGGLFGGGLFG